MNKLYVFFMYIALLVLSGCGTNVATEIKTTGIDGTIPIYGIPVGVRIGNAEVTTVATRGNTTYVTQNVTGGGLWSASAGTGRISILSSGPQLNEGYINEIMQSPNVPETAKIALVQDYLAKTKAPELTPTAVKTLAAASGQGTNPPTVEPASTGTDKIVDKIAETAPKVVPPIATATENITNNAVNKVGDVSTSALDTAKSISKSVAVIVIGLLILIGIAFYIYFKFFYKKGEIVQAIDTFRNNKEEVDSNKKSEVTHTDVPKEATIQESSIVVSETNDTKIVSEENNQ